MVAVSQAKDKGLSRPALYVSAFGNCRLYEAFEVRGVRIDSDDPRKMERYFGGNVWIHMAFLCSDIVVRALIKDLFDATERELQEWIKET